MTTLRKLAAIHSLLIGSLVGHGVRLDDSPQSKFIKNQTSLIFAAEASQWFATEPKPGKWNFAGEIQQFDFSPLDELLTFSKKTDKKMLVSTGGYADYLLKLSPSDRRRALIRHIRGMADYVEANKETIIAVNVFNEVFDQDGRFKDPTFVKIGLWTGIGSGPGDYVRLALRTGINNTTSAVFFLNDFAIEEVNKKSDGMFRFFSNLKKNGWDMSRLGIGMQCHLTIGRQNFESIRANVRRFKSLGIKVLFTELDVRIRIDDGLTAEELKKQKDSFYNITRIAVEEGVLCINMWGVKDPSWIERAFPGWGAATIHDGNFEEKPAFNGLVQALKS